MSHKKISRNAPCPCGSGKKYKKCCYGKDFDFEEDDQGHSIQAKTPVVMLLLLLRPPAAATAAK